MNRAARGFTLVELMIAVSIIAILATIGLTVYTGIQRGARDSKRQSEILEIQKALEQYYAINRTYPSSLTTVGTTYFPSGSIPHDPNSSANGGTGPDYSYTHCATAEHYALCTGGGAMETCVGSGSHPNCNATAAGDGCGPYTVSSATPPVNTLFCATSLSN